jgi:penicillin-binding protein 1C
MRFADRKAVALVTSVLSDNAARARAFGLDSALRLPFPAAAKTGTSKGYSDNWTVGFTHERTLAVWAGNFDGAPMVQVSGVSGAGPIFKRVMISAMHGLHAGPLFDERGLTSARICPLSGERAGPHCPAVMDERFVAGTAPHADCGMHTASAPGLPRALAAQCARLEAGQGRLVDLGVDFYDWAQAQGLAEEPWLAAACRGEAAAPSAAPRILFPADGDEFVLLADLPLADQAIPVRLRASPGLGSLELRLDGRLTQRLSAPFTTRIPAERGAHTLSVTGPDGEVLGEVRFLVRAERAL